MVLGDSSAGLTSKLVPSALGGWECGRNKVRLNVRFATRADNLWRHYHLDPETSANSNPIWVSVATKLDEFPLKKVLAFALMVVVD